MTNIGRFTQLTVPLATKSDNGSNITVFVGNNGAGKTTLLKALTTGLSWFIARLRREKGNGSPISPADIKNGQGVGQIELLSANNHDVYQWSTTKARRAEYTQIKASSVLSLNWLTITAKP